MMSTNYVSRHNFLPNKIACCFHDLLGLGRIRCDERPERRHSFSASLHLFSVCNLSTALHTTALLLRCKSIIISMIHSNPQRTRVSSQSNVNHRNSLFLLGQSKKNSFVLTIFYIVLFNQNADSLKSFKMLTYSRILHFKLQPFHPIV